LVTCVPFTMVITCRRRGFSAAGASSRLPAPLSSGRTGRGGAPAPPAPPPASAGELSPEEIGLSRSLALATTWLMRVVSPAFLVFCSLAEDGLLLVLRRRAGRSGS
jgi:hypothetical protein